MNGTIGEAKYLQKGSGDFIPFKLAILNTNCAQIEKML